MIGVVTVLPALLAVAVALRAGAMRAFAWVGLPCLLLLPNYYTWKLPGVPRFDFHNYMLLALTGLVLLGTRTRPRFHAIDLLVLLLIGLSTWSEYANKNFQDARNLFALSLMGLAAPYVLGKALARDGRAIVATVTVLALVGAFIGFSAPYEARMGSNPYDFWRRLWPESVPWDGALYRAGVRRVAGPFAHPICHGFFFSMSLVLVSWLVTEKLKGRGKLGAGLILGHISGLLLSVSRGPIMGTMIAMWIFGFGRSTRKAVWIGATTVAGLVGLAFTFDTLVGYVTVSRGDAVTESQETAAYRNEMLQNYLEVVDERPVLGFGKDQIPIVKGQKSIDNQYLFLALTHGLPAAYTFLALMVLPILCSAGRLLLRGTNTARSRLQWGLVGVLTGAIFTQITVFAGMQTTQMLFLLEGLTVGLLAPPEPGERGDPVADASHGATRL